MTTPSLQQPYLDKTAVIGIVGLGYVGLPLALTAIGSGYRVVGFDFDPDKVAAINAGKSYIKHIAGEDVDAAVQATAACARLADFDEHARGRRRHHLRADAADGAPRAGPELSSRRRPKRSRRTCRRVS